jgi:hypothetical protein
MTVVYAILTKEVPSYSDRHEHITGRCMRSWRAIGALALGAALVKELEPERPGLRVVEGPPAPGSGFGIAPAHPAVNNA